MNPRLHILFVDDDPNLLQALQRSLRPMRKDWDMAFADGGASALALLKDSAFDIVVSDMKMPGINGCDLLDKVMASHPGTLRFILSGHAERSQLMQCVGPTHQFLSKPCETGKLTASLQRVTHLEHLVPDGELRQWLAHLDRLPCHPDHHELLIHLLQENDPSIEKIGALIAKDPGMATLVLKLANTAFFGNGCGTIDIRLATTQLGADVLRSIGLTLHLFTPLNLAESAGFDALHFWQRSQRAAESMRRIAEQDHSLNLSPEEAYSVGLLLDIGSLALSGKLPGSGTSPLHHTPEVTTAQAGAYLLGTWGYSDAVVDAVAHQRSGSDTPPANPDLRALAQCVTSFLDDPSSDPRPNPWPVEDPRRPSWLTTLRDIAP